MSDSTELRSEILATVCDDNAHLLECLLTAVRGAGELPPSTAADAGLYDVALHCKTKLEAALAQAERDDGDWSIETGSMWHGCDDCVTLRNFLIDTDGRELEWPLAKPRRQHIHQVIDNAELPVHHVTQRTGRPYTLVLAKTAELFTQEQEQRRLNASDLGAINELLLQRGLRLGGQTSR